MPLDLYVEPTVSAETRQPPRKASPWIYTAAFVAACAFVLVGVWIFLNPSVDPDDDSIPTPPPVASGLHVLIVEETAEREQLPAEQIAIFSSIPLRQWYKAHCADEDGHPAYRNFDKDDNLDRENEIWQKLRAKITLSPPVLLMVDGKKGKEMKLPPNPEAMQAALEQFIKSKR